MLYNKCNFSTQQVYDYIVIFSEQKLDLCLNPIWKKRRTTITVKPAHAVSSIKQSRVLSGHSFLVLSYKMSYEMNLG